MAIIEIPGKPAEGIRVTSDKPLEGVRIIPAKPVEGIQVIPAKARERAAALEVLKPYLGEKGEYDVVAAVGAAVPPEALALLFTPKEIEGAEEEAGALETLKPYVTAEGKYNVTSAVEAGVSDDTLSVLFTPEEIEGAHEKAAALEVLKPYLGEEGKYYVVSAIEAGVSDDTLSLLFPPEEIAGARAQVAEIKEFEAMHVEGAEGKWIPKDVYDTLSLGYQEIFDTVGLTELQGVQKERDEFLALLETAGAITSEGGIDVSKALEYETSAPSKEMYGPYGMWTLPGKLTGIRPITAEMLVAFVPESAGQVKALQTLAPYTTDEGIDVVQALLNKVPQYNLRNVGVTAVGISDAVKDIEALTGEMREVVKVEGVGALSVEGLTAEQEFEKYVEWGVIDKDSAFAGVDEEGRLMYQEPGVRGISYGAVVAEALVPGMYLARHWGEMSNLERTGFIALEVVSLLPLVGWIAKTGAVSARTIKGVSVGYRSLQAVKSIGHAVVALPKAMLWTFPKGVVTKPVATLKGLVSVTAEPIIHPVRTTKTLVGVATGSIQLGNIIPEGTVITAGRFGTTVPLRTVTGAPLNVYYSPHPQGTGMSWKAFNKAVGNVKNLILDHKVPRVTGEGWPELSLDDRARSFVRSVQTLVSSQGYNAAIRTYGKGAVKAVFPEAPRLAKAEAVIRKITRPEYAEVKGKAEAEAQSVYQAFVDEGGLTRLYPQGQGLSRNQIVYELAGLKSPEFRVMPGGAFEVTPAQPQYGLKLTYPIYVTDPSILMDVYDVQRGMFYAYGEMPGRSKAKIFTAMPEPADEVMSKYPTEEVLRLIEGNVVTFEKDPYGYYLGTWGELLSLSGLTDVDRAENLVKAVQFTVRRDGYGEALKQFGLLPVLAVYPYAIEMALYEEDPELTSEEAMSGLSQAIEYYSDPSIPKETYDVILKALEGFRYKLAGEIIMEEGTTPTMEEFRASRGKGILPAELVEKYKGISDKLVRRDEIRSGVQYTQDWSTERIARADAAIAADETRVLLLGPVLETEFGEVGTVELPALEPALGGLVEFEPVAVAVAVKPVAEAPMPEVPTLAMPSLEMPSLEMPSLEMPPLEVPSLGVVYEVVPEPVPEVVPEPVPEPEIVPELVPEPALKPAPAPMLAAVPEIVFEPIPAIVLELVPEPEPELVPEPVPVPTPTPTPTPTPVPAPIPTPIPTPTPTPTPTPITAPLLIPPPPPAGEARRRVYLEDSVTWRQGLSWIVVEPPYTPESMSWTDMPPEGVFQVDIGKPSETVQGRPDVTFTVPVGMFDATYSRGALSYSQRYSQRPPVQISPEELREAEVDSMSDEEVERAIVELMRTKFSGGTSTQRKKARTVEGLTGMRQ